MEMFREDESKHGLWLYVDRGDELIFGASEEESSDEEDFTYFDWLIPQDILLPTSWFLWNLLICFLLWIILHEWLV